MIAREATIRRAIQKWAADRLDTDDDHRSEVFQLVTNRADLLAAAIEAALPDDQIIMATKGDALAVHRMLVIQASRAAVRLGQCPWWRWRSRARLRWSTALLAMTARSVEQGEHLAAQAACISAIEGSPNGD